MSHENKWLKMSNLICTAIHIGVHFIYWSIQTAAYAVARRRHWHNQTHHRFEMLIEKFPNGKHPSNKNIMKIKSEKNMFFYFIVFYCLFCSRSLCCTVLAVLLMLAVVLWCWYRWNAAAAAACATYCMAIHPSRITAGAIRQLSFSRRDNDFGALRGRKNRNKNRKNQKRDWINGMFALIICLNIGSKSTEKPNAPFMCVSLAAVVNCVCVLASMRSRVFYLAECEWVQIKTKPCGTKMCTRRSTAAHTKNNFGFSY